MYLRQELVGQVHNTSSSRGASLVVQLRFSLAVLVSGSQDGVKFQLLVQFPGCS